MTDTPLASYFLQARHYGNYNNLPVDRVVIHYMGSSEKKDTAENVAQYFHTMSDGRVASAHYCVDVDSIVQCVYEKNIAYHAPPNTHSIGIEHAGTEQTKEQWADAYSQTMLKLSAKLCADICKRHDIPIVKLTVDDLKAGKRGICGHVDVSNAFHKSDHTDPGVAFPWVQYLGWVKQAMTGQEDDLPYTETQLKQIIRDVMNEPPQSFKEGGFFRSLWRSVARTKDGKPAVIPGYTTVIQDVQKP